MEISENEIGISKMLSVAILAFIGEMFGSILQQVCFVLMKLAHRQIEMNQKRNLVQDETEQLNSSNIQDPDD